VNKRAKYRGMLVSVLMALLFGCLAQTLTAASEHHLTKKELKALIANAKTSEDHQKVAAYYRAEAKRLRADAQEHKQWADIYAKGPAGSVA
jgi:hypothetical protein